MSELGSVAGDVATISGMRTPLAPRRWSIEEYHRMAAAGILGEDDRVELLDGEIVEMSPIGSVHAAAVRSLARHIQRAAGEHCLVSVQDPIRLPPASEPQPDLALLRLRDDLYRSELPAAGDVLVVIEVADSSVAVDRRVKLPLYARAGIAEAWLVDLSGSTLEVWLDPTEQGYTTRRIFRSGETVVATAMPDLEVPVDVALALPAAG
jgi:Uma2 family endonuclease